MPAKSEIIEARPLMLGINLDRPFPLGFGTLEKLPRVLLAIKVESQGKVVEGIGEASIDFPFSNYDAWDIYHALLESKLEGKKLDNNFFSNEYLIADVLSKYPAAFTAINMAVDDAQGKIDGKSILDYKQTRKGGKALASISFHDQTDTLIQELESKFHQGFIPKPKVGQGTDKDVETITAIDKISRDRQIPYVLDFNAQYTPGEFKKIVDSLRNNLVDLSRLVFIEQPTTTESGIEGLYQAKRTLQDYGYDIRIVADESFVTVEDALQCAQLGIALNFKIHKVGGRYQAQVIEQALIKAGASELKNMVGGTFPTAIGRTYDQQVAAQLKTTTLPGDGWEPSTDWFTGDKHLIHESFNFDPVTKRFIPIKGPGLGITPDWKNIQSFKIDDPRGEYRKIRSGQSGEQISISLKPGQSYGEVYKAKSGINPDWNL